MKTVVSLYDYTGEALKPWAKKGYKCYAFDIQHPIDGRVEDGIHYQHIDLHNYNKMSYLCDSFNDGSVVFGMAFPVCTDLAVSGAAWFKKKAEVDPDFQKKAAMYASWCADFFDDLGCPYFIENPVSVLSTLWRKPDYRFHPYEYGGYIPYGEEQHPQWPEFIADRDAYPKKTCLWTGNSFVMPNKVSVEPEVGHSRQHLKLGGKSMKTKNIRSATPRGFAIAVMESNGDILP